MHYFFLLHHSLKVMQKIIILLSLGSLPIFCHAQQPTIKAADATMAPPSNPSNIIIEKSIRDLNQDFKMGILQQDRMPVLIPKQTRLMPNYFSAPHNQAGKIPNAWPPLDTNQKITAPATSEKKVLNPSQKKSRFIQSK